MSLLGETYAFCVSFNTSQTVFSQCLIIYETHYDSSGLSCFLEVDGLLISASEYLGYPVGEPPVVDDHPPPCIKTVIDQPFLPHSKEAVEDAISAYHLRREQLT